MKRFFLKSQWMSWTLWLAAAYNLLWGAYVVLFPTHLFDLLQLPRPLYLPFWQCIGMIVGVYGLGYGIAARSPLKHWPIVLVGFLGKIFGPIGFVQASLTQDFPRAFGVVILTNDLIWWIPFGLILWRAWDSSRGGEPITLKESQWQAFDQRQRAQFINSLSGYKSANLIGTCSAEGVPNLSLKSSVFHLGADPALLGFIIRPDSVPRDTLRNLRATGQGTLNHVHQGIFKAAHQCSARYPQEVSEFAQVGLTPEYHSPFMAPFVQEAFLKLSFELLREERLPENGTHLIIARIRDVYLPSKALRADGSLDLARTETIAVAGLDQYVETSPLARMAYAKADRPPRAL